LLARIKCRAFKLGAFFQLILDEKMSGLNSTLLAL
jgi:hypothetical protein